MPRRDGTGPRGRGPLTGRGGGFCKGTGRASALAEIVGGLAVGLLAWGGQALSRRLAAGRTLPPAETPPVLDISPDRPAIGAGELAELLDRARLLERELEMVRQRIRTLESDKKR
jgi:hypothetical protein